MSLHGHEIRLLDASLATVGVLWNRYAEFDAVECVTRTVVEAEDSISFLTADFTYEDELTSDTGTYYLRLVNFQDSTDIRTYQIKQPEKAHLAGQKAIAVTGDRIWCHLHDRYKYTAKKSFANIAIGQSSIIADKVGLKLGDYHITESGFGADIGFEKFWNLKCRMSGLTPQCAVLVATIRALKCHGGAPIPVPGKPMPKEYDGENVEWVEKGCANLVHHVNNVKKAGINPVVCINAFHTDTAKEVATVRKHAEKAGARCAVCGRRRGPLFWQSDLPARARGGAATGAAGQCAGGERGLFEAGARG
jgi:hypothetical protein